MTTTLSNVTVVGSPDYYLKLESGKNSGYARLARASTTTDIQLSDCWVGYRFRLTSGDPTSQNTSFYSLYSADGKDLTVYLGNNNITFRLTDGMEFREIGIINSANLELNKWYYLAIYPDNGGIMFSLRDSAGFELANDGPYTGSPNFNISSWRLEFGVNPAIGVEVYKSTITKIQSTNEAVLDLSDITWDPIKSTGSTNAKFTAGSEPVLDKLSFQIADTDTLPMDFTPDSGIDGYSWVTVKGIDNLEASNIKDGVTIAGVTGTVVEMNAQDRTAEIPAAVSLPIVFGYSSGYNCLNSVTLNSIENLEASNIKDGVTIAGVTGTYSGSTPTLVTKTITENGTYSASSDSADGYSEVTVSVSGGSSSKYGVSIDNIIGDVNSYGFLYGPSPINGITFTGVTEIGTNALSHAFYKRGLVSGLIAFPALTTVGNGGLYSAFHNNQITLVDLSSLTTVGVAGLTNTFSDNQITSVDLSSLITVDQDGLTNAFQNNQITEVDLSALTTVGNYGLQYAFQNNQITEVNLSSLTTVDQNGLYSAFQNNQITEVDLSALTTVNQSGLENVFSSNQITSVDLSALTTVGNHGLSNAFYNNKLVNINFPNLEHLDNYALASAFSYNGTSDAETGEFNPSLQSVSFPALNSQSFGESTDQFYEMLSGDDGVTVHFPSNLQSVIGDWDAVTNGFGGTNTTVLFDLPATE